MNEVLVSAVLGQPDCRDLILDDGEMAKSPLSVRVEVDGVKRKEKVSAVSTCRKRMLQDHEKRGGFFRDGDVSLSVFYGLRVRLLVILG